MFCPINTLALLLLRNVGRAKDNAMAKKETNNDLQNTTLKIKPELHEPRFKSGVTSCVPKRLAVPAPPVTPVMLMLNDMNII